MQLEIWMGCGNAQERQHLREMMALVPCLSIDGDVWAEAFRLAERSRNAGLRIPANDILIAACARVHEVFVESADKHFDLLAKL